MLLNVVNFVTNLSLLPRATLRLLPATNLSWLATSNCFLFTSRAKLLKRTWNFCRSFYKSRHTYIYIYIYIYLNRRNFGQRSTLRGAVTIYIYICLTEFKTFLFSALGCFSFAYGRTSGLKLFDLIHRTRSWRNSLQTHLSINRAQISRNFWTILIIQRAWRAVENNRQSERVWFLIWNSRERRSVNNHRLKMLKMNVMNLKCYQQIQRLIK